MRSMLVAIVALSTALSSAVSSQTIAGLVRDKQSRKPLNHVSIQLVSDTGSTSAVLAKTVSDTNGIFYVQAPALLKSTHPDFTASVRAAVPFMRFSPAEIKGRKVKQLVRMPF